MAIIGGIPHFQTYPYGNHEPPINCQRCGTGALQLDCFLGFPKSQNSLSNIIKPGPHRSINHKKQLNVMVQREKYRKKEMKLQICVSKHTCIHIYIYTYVYIYICIYICIYWQITWSPLDFALTGPWQKKKTSEDMATTLNLVGSGLKSQHQSFPRDVTCRYLML